MTSKTEFGERERAIFSSAYRKRVKETNPDQSGSDEQYQHVQRAREDLLDAE